MAAVIARRPREGAEIATAVRMAGEQLRQRTSHSRSHSRPRGLVLTTVTQRERTDDGSFRDIFRALFLRVIQRGLVPLSSAPDNDEGGDSEPDSDDDRFAARVLRLEEHRSRPPSQGTGNQVVVATTDIVDLLDPWEEEVTRRSWSGQPRGLTSEWHWPRCVPGAMLLQ